MFRTKYIFLLLLSSLYSIVSHAQTSESKSEFSISGTVHGTDGETLPGASVYVLENSRLGAFSDEDGLFALELPHKGPWSL
jgi:hypothetical protein